VPLRGQCRGNRLQLELREQFDDALEHGPRLGRVGCSIVVAQCHQHLRARRAGARDARKRSGNGPRRAVGITVADAATKRIGHLAMRIHQVDGFRNLHAGFEQPRTFTERQTLAAQGAADIREHGIDVLKIGAAQRIEFPARRCNECRRRKMRNGSGFVHAGALWTLSRQ